MRRKPRLYISGRIPVLLTLLTLLLSQSTALAVYQVGDQVTTNFTLNDVNGISHSLFDYEGQCVLMNFFTTW